MNDCLSFYILFHLLMVGRGRRGGMVFWCFYALLFSLQYSLYVSILFSHFSVMYLGKLTIPWKVKLFEDNEIPPKENVFYCKFCAFLIYQIININNNIVQSYINLPRLLSEGLSCTSKCMTPSNHLFKKASHNYFKRVINNL